VPLSRPFYRVLNLMRFGEHRGGMYVLARGVAGGRAAARSWHLLAEGDDGPFIPSMAIEAIVRKLLAGDRPAPGARSGISALELDDYAPCFAGRRIFTGFREDEPEAPLYRRLLGPAFNALPAQIQELHGTAAPRRWAGTASVKRGRGLIANLIAAMIGLPRSAVAVPVTVDFSPENGGERWRRTFGGKSFSSLQTCGSGRNSHLMVERFGLAAYAIALVIEEDRLLLVPRRWSLCGIAMPRRLLPTAASYETARDERFSFNVDISIPLIGRIVAYEGVLEAA
jgi:hypothetical protein